MQVLYLKLRSVFILMCCLFPWDGNTNQEWQLEGANITTNNSGAEIKLDKLTMNNFELSNIFYSCPGGFIIYPIHECPNAQLSFDYGHNSYHFLADAYFDTKNNNWSANLSTIDGQAGIELNGQNDVANVNLNSFKLDQLFKSSELSINSIDGIVDGVVNFDYIEQKLSSQNVLKFENIFYEYSDDVIVAGLSGEITFDMDILNQTLISKIDITAGEMLFDQLYLDFKKFPISVSVDIHQDKQFNFIVNAAIINKQSMDINVQLSMDDTLNWKITNFIISIQDSHHFNQHVTSNVLGIYGFGNTEMSGGLILSLYPENTLFDRWQVTFNDFYLLNKKRKLQIDALDGKVNWDINTNSDNSVVRWESLTFAGMPVKQSQLDFNLSQSNFNLLGTHKLPVFDGYIVLKELKMESLFSPFIDMNLEAEILPMSLKLITQKLGWPEMSGSISGEIPGMVKKGSVIEFLGALKLSVFEGEMLVENLSLERLFGVAPVIAADVSFEKFNLSMLTETFGFGQITGHLSGVVKQLRITNWKTDRLDAQVYTVKSKDVKQTISQRAIENISSLGGIKGAISKTFLRFFDDFKYKRIKLSCKLHNSVCQIGGIKNKNNQFVIVEGGGIPKINIVGFVRSINWEEFIDRLLNANYE